MKTIAKLLVVAGVVLAAGVAETSAESDRPAVLVCSPNGTWDPRVDLNWLKELKQRGWEPDYLDNHGDFTWERIKRYNVLVLYGCPPERRGQAHTFGYPNRPPYQPEYLALIERYLEAGGGVFCMAYVHNGDEGIRAMIQPWGVRLPLEVYIEEDPNKIAPIPRMRGHERVALVDQVLPSPISDGVRRLWMPYSRSYNTSWTAPVQFSDDWHVVVRGSKTSRSEPVDLSQSTIPAPPDALIRPEGVKEPDLIAIRSYRKGRLFFACQWPQFTVGQGTAWLYDRVVLSKGAKGIPSGPGVVLLVLCRSSR
ncbi:MAG TPA: hypothetical protein EYP14_03480, partial [Planctomycetaceae bacterium]|nr:hypothetical protein [Planctomycetaceae bacterium]